MDTRKLKECERIALHLMNNHDDAIGALEENYRNGLYTKLEYVTISGFISYMSAIWC